jgi:YD repeat-containing protein
MNAPAGMLCEISFSNFQANWQTFLQYDSYGRLLQIINPGATISQLGYDCNGRLSDIRDPLMVDAETNGYGTGGPDTTHVNYYTATSTGCSTTSATSPDGAVESVTSPVAAAGQAQPKRTYHYSPTTNSTTTSIAGFAPPLGYAQKVVYDTQGRIVQQLRPISATAALTASIVWDSQDRPVVSVDETGRQTTTVYDDASRPTDTYGPAPSTCFSPTPPYTPIGGCGVTVPHVSTNYDTTFSGLAASYWPTVDFTGTPVKHATGIGTDTTLDHSWSSAPYGADDRDNWSLRLEGLINVRRRNR